MAEVAVAHVSLVPSARGFGGKISSQIGGDLDAAGKSGGKRLGAGVSGGFLPSIKGLMGPVAALFAVGAVVGFFKSANAEARESQKVGALTANVIKTTGGVAKITAGQVGDLSMAISNKTGVDDEAIQHGSNLLLTFKNVRNEVGKGANVFDRATAAAVDLSASGFGDVAGSSKMLGKALNDPMKGITALGRAGVTFTAGQKKQIEGFVKAGDLLGAQKIIMAEVESQVGGAAAASATAGEKLSTTWGNFKETIGTALLPVIDKVMSKATSFFGFLTTNGVPALQKVGGFLSANATAFKVVGVAVGGLTVLTAAHSLVVAFNSGAIAAWVAQTTIAKVATAAWSAVQAVLNVVLSANPIGLVVLAIAALVGGLIYAYKTSATFRGIVQGAFKGVVAAFGWVWDKAKAVFGWLKSNWTLILAIITGPIGLAVWAIVAHWDTIKSTISRAVGAVLGYVGGLAAIPGKLRDYFGRAYTAAAGKLGELVSFARGIPAKILAGLGNLGSLLFDKGKAIIQGLIDGVGSMVGNLASAVGNAIKKGITDLLPGSPVKKGPLRVLNRGYAGGQIVKMLTGGIDSQRAAMEASMTGLVSLPRVGSLDFASPSARAGAVAGSGVTQHIYPTPGMSELEVGVMAANQLEWAMRGNR